MIRTKGEPGTGDVVQAVRHMRMMMSEIRKVVSMSEDELYEEAKQLQVPYELVKYVHENGKLPVVNFAAGGVATPADAALMMQLGAEGVFVGSGIFKSGNPAKRARAIVQAVTNYENPAILAELSEDLGEAMWASTSRRSLPHGGARQVNPRAEFIDRRRQPEYGLSAEQQSRLRRHPPQPSAPFYKMKGAALCANASSSHKAFAKQKLCGSPVCLRKRQGSLLNGK